MRRIAVIGCGGAGKTTLARELGERLGIEVLCLDRLYWRPGWEETPHEEWAALQQELVAGDSWIVDGNYGRTMEIRLAAADTVVYLDAPTSLCLWRVLRRQVTCALTRRPHLGPGLPDRLGPDFLRFLAYVATFRRRKRATILDRLARCSAEPHVLHSRSEIRAFLDSVQ